MKMFLGYPNFYSVTNMLIELQLPSFSTVMHNYKLFNLTCTGRIVVMMLSSILTVLQCIG